VENQKPIGIFDSGLGGLSIARSIRDILPDEDIVYFADSKYSPYGSKSKALCDPDHQFLSSV